jgi:hypothetical protein
MWQSAGYENKLVWVIVIGVMVALAATAIWLYQINLVTFGLKHLNAAGCPGDEVSIQPRDGNIFDKRCIKPSGNNRGPVDCSKIPDLSFYTTPDGGTGTCFGGNAQPALN